MIKIPRAQNRWRCAGTWHTPPPPSPLTPLSTPTPPLHNTVSSPLLCSPSPHTHHLLPYPHPHSSPHPHTHLLSPISPHPIPSPLCPLPQPFSLPSSPDLFSLSSPHRGATSSPLSAPLPLPCLRAIRQAESLAHFSLLNYACMLAVAGLALSGLNLQSGTPITQPASFRLECSTCKYVV